MATEKAETDRVPVTLSLATIAVSLAFLKDGEVERIERTLHFSAPLTDEQKARLLEIAGKTPVTKTVMHGAAISTTLG